ncbi:hypothetical protein [Roseateles saccharophilus]|uniref:Translation initiation factor 2 n=1 Tax=Roseateles saccharophilus TaxID=304 RepID=A0A4R3UZD5_ROSSA|nr:hypothetical protein [Roseateles saccharophilus]MDG0835362.1 hypothetical protein [Roseateles saccharophilus]TCU96168.1 hypothetical protein EV671_101446 [Roseateles saccharophilus]
MRLIIYAALVAVSLQLVGCASVSNGTTGSMRVETVSAAGQAVEGATCNLTNDSGTVSVTTPGSVLVHRSSSDLHVECKKVGEPSAAGTVTSRVAGSLFGNILIGGGIGAIVDHSNGSAYNYPEWIRLVMGDSEAVFDRKDFVAGAPTLSRKPPTGAERKEAVAPVPAEVPAINSVPTEGKKAATPTS